MVSAQYYRNEAERCRLLAAGSQETGLAARWLALARDYDALAESLEAEEGAPRLTHTPVQQQPVQQQQSKTEPEDDEK